MTENMENMEFATQQTMNTAADEVKTNIEEKTYTQAEVDNIVKSRLARERSKNKNTVEEQVTDTAPDTKSIKERLNEDMAWFEQNVGGDFDTFIRSKDFHDFLDGTSLNVRTGMEKYVKLKGAEAVKKSLVKNTPKPASPGSVKDSGASDLKDYYTPEDVDRLSENDYKNPEVMKRVRQSMTKWR